MALYILSITLCDCGEKCLPQNIIVDADINDLIVGNVYSFSSITDCDQSKCIRFGCYVIEYIKSTVSQANAIIVNSYGPSEPNGCDDCIDDISNYLVFQSCFNLFQTLYIPIDQITPTPTEGVVYYLEYAISSEGNVYQAFGCFQFMGRKYIPLQQVDEEVLVLTATTQTDCQTCLENSAILYEGLDCLTNQRFIIGLPSEGLENHLISYTDLAGLTQYCGVIQGTVQDSGLPDALLVSDLGLLNEETNNCEDCLAQANEKKELINCLDLTTEIVWASVLFDTGNSTHLSKGEGCYEVGEIVPPETQITINELANYDPQENCEDCLECYGVIYEFTSCEEIEVCGPTNIMSNNNLYVGMDFVIDSSNNMFVPFFNSNILGKYDLTTQTFVEQSAQILSNPESVAIDETNGVICVTNSNSNYVTFFDYNDLTLSFDISSLVYFPKKAYYEPIDGYFYVAFNDSF
jgi:hypothetical protein